LRSIIRFALALTLTATSASGASAHPHEGPAADSLRESMVAAPRAAGLPAPSRAVLLSNTFTWIPAAAGLALTLGCGDHGVETTGAIVLGAGVVLGPAVGYMYGDCSNRGLAGALLRGGLCALAVGAARSVESWRESTDNNAVHHGLEKFGGLAASGALAVIAAAAWDVAQVRERVYLRNEERAALRLGAGLSRSGGPAIAMRIDF